MRGTWEWDGVPSNTVALNKQCHNTVWKEHVPKWEPSSCNSLLLLQVALLWCSRSAARSHQRISFGRSTVLLSQLFTGTDQLLLSQITCSLNWQKGNGVATVQSEVFHTVQNFPSNLKKVTEFNALSQKLLLALFRKLGWGERKQEKRYKHKRRTLDKQTSFRFLQLFTSSEGNPSSFSCLAGNPRESQMVKSQRRKRRNFT